MLYWVYFKCEYPKSPTEDPVALCLTFKVEDRKQLKVKAHPVSM